MHLNSGQIKLSIRPRCAKTGLRLVYVAMATSVSSPMVTMNSSRNWRQLMQSTNLSNAQHFVRNYTVLMESAVCSDTRIVLSKKLRTTTILLNFNSTPRNFSRTLRTKKVMTLSSQEDLDSEFSSKLLQIVW